MYVSVIHTHYNVACLMSYTFFTIDLQFYTKTVGPYWPPDRLHIDRHYADIKPDMNNIYDSKDVERIEVSMSKTLNLPRYVVYNIIFWYVIFCSFIGYLTTWSAVNGYKKAHPDKPDPLVDLQKQYASLFLTGCLVFTSFVDLRVCWVQLARFT